jgi:hypothetical protein
VLGPTVGNTDVGAVVGIALGATEAENMATREENVTLPNPVTGSQPALVTNPELQQVAVVEELLAQHLLSPDVISLKYDFALL